MNDILYKFTYLYRTGKAEIKRTEHRVTRETETHVYFMDGEKEVRSRKIFLDQPRMRVGNYKTHLHFEMATWNAHIPSAKRAIQDHIGRNIVDQIRKAEEQLDSVLNFHEVFERNRI